MWPPNFRKDGSSESKEEEFSIPRIQLSNETPPICNTVRIIPDGEEQQKAQAEKKAGWHNQKGTYFLQSNIQPCSMEILKNTRMVIE